MLVIGAYAKFEEALDAVAELIDDGFAPKSLSLVARIDRHAIPGATPSDPGSWAALSDTFATTSVGCGRGSSTSIWANGPLAAALHDGGRSGNGAFLDALAGAGVRRTTAWRFVDAVCSGRVLLSVQCQESCVRDARKILDGHRTGNRPTSIPIRAGKGVRVGAAGECASP